jgi:trimeric autotransporter adhesin
MASGSQRGSSLLVSGQAVLTTSSLTAGGHQLGAHYGGDPNFLTSDATPVAVPVSQHTVGVDLTSSANSAPTGSPITLTVNFFDGTTLLGTLTLGANQQTTLRLLLTAGTHRLSVQYAGDPNFLSGTSATLTQVVSPLAVIATPSFTG